MFRSLSRVQSSSLAPRRMLASTPLADLRTATDDIKSPRPAMRAPVVGGMNRVQLSGGLSVPPYISADNKWGTM